MTETLIVGGGPAGCAAAIALAGAGHQAILLERDAVARETVCGEFLGVDTAHALRALGLDPATLGATPIRAVRLAATRRETRLALPFAAWGLPRRTLDHALRQRAREAGAVLRHATVQHATPTRAGWQLRTGEAVLDAPLLLLATGKHALRGHPRLPAPVGAVGLKLHLENIDLAPEIALLPFADGYAGLQPLPGGGANLCAALHGDPGEPARDANAFLARVANSSAAAARLLRDARPAWARPLVVAGVPYGFRFDPGATRPGLFRLGDQVSVIPSLAGEGIAMALHSGLDAAAAILAGHDAARFHAAWRRRTRRPMALAWLLARVFGPAPGVLAVGAARLPGVARGIAALSRC